MSHTALSSTPRYHENLSTSSTALSFHFLTHGAMCTRGARLPVVRARRARARHAQPLPARRVHPVGLRHLQRKRRILLAGEADEAVGGAGGDPRARHGRHLPEQRAQRGRVGPRRQVAHEQLRRQGRVPAQRVCEGFVRKDP